MSDTIRVPLSVATRLCAELDAGENADTPETNAAERMAYSHEHMVPTEVARKLERERDEALDQSRWKSTKVALPTAGEWVLHTYKGVRAPEYGIYERGHFFRGGGPESFPATHWLSVPNISCVKCGETLRGDEDESEAHCKWCVQGWESTTSDPTEAAK